MTLLFTESFGSFKRLAGTNLELANAETFTAVQGALARVGITTTNNPAYLGPIVVADPINPERSAISVAMRTGTPSQYAKIHWPLGLQGSPIVFGFSLFLPREWPDLPADNNVLVDVVAGPANQMATGSGAARVEGRLFSIGVDRRVRLAAAANTTQSQRQATLGGMTYFEVRHANNGVRVWMDDALVYETTDRVWEGGIGFAFAISSSLAALYAAGSSLRPSVSNVYCLTEDAHAPNVRLGPTTRVIPRRPAGDVDVEFLRPDGFSSNTQVVEQDVIGDIPVNTLQSENVGTRDEYALAAHSAIANAPKVHAVVSKVVASNLESTPHEIRPWVKTGDSETVDEFAYETEVKRMPLAEQFWAATAREDGTIFVCGRGPSILYSTDGGDTWAVGYNGATSVTARDITVGPDGTVRACCSNGTILCCNGTDGPDVWSVETTGTTSNIAFIAVSPSGTWVTATAGSTHPVKEGAAAWRLQTRRAGVSQYVGWVEDRFVTAHSSYLMHSFTGADGTWFEATGISNFSYLAGGVVKVDGRYLLGGQFLDTSNWLTIPVVDNLPQSGALGWVLETHSLFRAAININSATTLAGYAKAPDGLVLVVPYNRALIWTRNGRAFNTVADPAFAQLNYFGKPAVIPNGFLVPVVNAAGQDFIVLVRKRKAGRPLLNIDGYTQHTNIASLDPSTGLPWVPSAAAGATVGMTLDK